MGIAGRFRDFFSGGVLSATARRLGGAFRTELDKARRFEAAGKLEEATASFLKAGSKDDAARVYALRADTTADGEARCRLLTQAAAVATGQRREELRTRRAELLLDLVRDERFHLGRGELVALGRELEELEQPALAAQAYGLAGDVDGQTRALVEAGSVERLEEVLDAEQRRDRVARRRLTLERRVRDLHESGRRREALAACREPDATGLEGVMAVQREIEMRRVRGPDLRLRIAEGVFEMALGEDITIGRAESSVVVRSPALSRSHLRLRQGVGGPEALDLGSSNGTALAGARLDVPAVVPEEGQLDLVLGGEVRLRLTRWDRGVRLAFGERVVHAPLGPLLIEGWRIETSPDGWVELTVVEGEAYLNHLRVGMRVQLLRGDALRREAQGPVVLEVLA